MSLKEHFHQLTSCCQYRFVSTTLQFSSTPVCCQILPLTQPQYFVHLNLQQATVVYLTTDFYKEAQKAVLSHSHWTTMQNSLIYFFSLHQHCRPLILPWIVPLTGYLSKLVGVSKGHHSSSPHKTASHFSPLLTQDHGTATLPSAFGQSRHKQNWSFGAPKTTVILV